MEDKTKQPEITAAPTTASGAISAHLKSFEGAVAIITGGASGIGRALAEELANKGAHAVVLVDRQKELAEEVATGLRTNNKRTEAKVYEVDVREFTEVKKVVTETIESYGRLDFMFNNAGIAVSAALDKMPVEDFNYGLDVNVRGVTNGIHAAYPVMKEQGFGHIINTSSVAGLMPIGEGFIAYGTSKYAVFGMSVNLRVEAARHGVRVSVLCPGVVDTPILRGGGKYGKDLTGIPEEEVDKIWAKYKPMEPSNFAKKVLKLVAKNLAIIIVPGYPWKMIWFVSRLFPSLGLFMARKKNDKLVKRLQKVVAEESA